MLVSCLFYTIWTGTTAELDDYRIRPTLLSGRGCVFENGALIELGVGYSNFQYLRPNFVGLDMLIVRKY